VLVLKLGFVALSALGLAGALAWQARDAGRPWAVTGALLLGPDEDDEVDLRFRAFASGTLVVIIIALAFQDAVRGAGAARVALTLALVLPLLTALLAALADLGARALERRAVAAEPGALDDIIEEARLEVSGASGRVTDPNLLAALDALGARVLGVAALARTCADVEAREAIRLLGVREHASAEEIAAVCRALLPIYRGEAALPGIDAARGDAISAAARRLAA
jgi:hypothetical protein